MEHFQDYCILLSQLFSSSAIRRNQNRDVLKGMTKHEESFAEKEAFLFGSGYFAVTAICPWNLFCRDHSRVFT